MKISFDEAYAKYQSLLAKLDTTHDIAAKNLLFRELTERLFDLEKSVKNSYPTTSGQTPNENSDNTPSV